MEKITTENFKEKIVEQEMRDFLSSHPHPVQEMDDAGYTYLDYVLFKTKVYNRGLVKLVTEINLLIDKKTKVAQWSNGRAWHGNIN